MVLALIVAALAPAAASASLPQVDYALAGRTGDNGWFTGPVTITWTVTGATDFDCLAVETLRDDTPGTQRTCTASNADGTVPATTKVIKIDQTPPTGLAAAPTRPPDAPPFYTAPVPITWSATDGTSGIAACTTLTYGGPDGPAVAPTGGCRDRAGNPTPALALTFAYDATAPALSAVTATARPDRTVALSWTTDADAQTVSVVRQPGGVRLLDAAPAATTHGLSDGPLAPSTSVTYTVTARDAAGNATSATAAATTPAAGGGAAAQSAAAERASRTLRWKRRAGASYYNVQLFRGGRKILSAWPRSNHYTLKTRWRYRGHRHTLAAGRYRWYVWPGYGPRAAHRYGRLVAKGALTRPARAG